MGTVDNLVDSLRKTVQGERARPLSGCLGRKPGVVGRTLKTCWTIPPGHPDRGCLKCGASRLGQTFPRAKVNHGNVRGVVPFATLFRRVLNNLCWTSGTTGKLQQGYVANVLRQGVRYTTGDVTVCRAGTIVQQVARSRIAHCPPVQ